MNSTDPAPVKPPPPPPVLTEHVLVVTRDLAYGASIRDSDTAWVEWPKQLVPSGALLKSETPTAKEEIKGRYVRVAFANGEPMRLERLISTPTTKLMATVVAPGHRAVAIDINAHAANAAGGFVLPNDHVDVIRTYHGQARGVEVVGSETIVRNVRVLAMGQTTESVNSDPAATMITATLELDSSQAELVILGQRTGQLSLALLSMADWSADDASVQPTPAVGPLSGAFSVLGGRLTVPRDQGGATKPIDKAVEQTSQTQNFTPRQVLNGN